MIIIGRSLFDERYVKPYEPARRLLPDKWKSQIAHIRFLFSVHSITQVFRKFIKSRPSLLHRDERDVEIHPQTKKECIYLFALDMSYAHEFFNQYLLSKRNLNFLRSRLKTLTASSNFASLSLDIAGN